MKEDISLIVLAEKERLTMRSVNICENAGLTSLNKILKYFHKKGTFIQIRNCGFKSDKELIAICKKYQSHIIANNPIESNNILSIFNELSPFKKAIVNKHIEYLVYNLSTRGNSGLKSISDPLIPKIIVDAIYRPAFNFKDIRNIGEKTVEELNLFKKDILSFIEALLELNENELSKEFSKLILRTNFADLSETFEEQFEDVFDENGKLKLFKLIDLLIETDQIFNKKKKLLFLYSYRFSGQNFSLDTIAAELQLTTERVRQIRVQLIKELPNYLQFISNFRPEDFVGYQVGPAFTCVVIDQIFADKLNQKEAVDFNPLFYSLIFSIICKSKFSVLGYYETIIGNNKLTSRNRYKSCYLISRTLFEIFDFETFVKDVYSRLNDRITKSYTLHFADYLCQFLRNENHRISTLLSELTETCEAIIFNEFDLVVSQDRYLKFERNTKKQVHEYAFEILNDKGELMTIDEISKAIKLKYPEFKVNPSSISSSMIREKKLFLSIGKSSTFGLRKWENEREYLKGGTIRDIIEEYLTMESEPKHISEILNYVSKYRNSKERSVMNNIKVDESNRFVFYEGNFIGLRNKSYPSSSTDFKRVVGAIFSQRVLKKYDGWILDDFIEHYVNKYDYQPVQVKHMIDKKINKNQIRLTLDNRLSM